MNTTSHKRLASLDLLRGFDLFCLLMLQPISMTWLKIADNPAWEPLARQFTHVPWEGVSFWDLIMPLFMFMSGITIPFSMSKYKREEKTDHRFYLRLLKRFAVLFFLGWIVQGNLLALDPACFHLYANTLQAIAVGYVVTVLCFVRLPLRGQIGAMALFFFAYLLVFSTVGKMDYEPGTNIAEEIDRCVLGRLRDGVLVNDDGCWDFDPNYHYTWILSSLNFVVTVMLGCFAGQILRMPVKESQRLTRLLGVGVILTAVALAMTPVFPLIKHIWSSSMTLFYGGVCFLLMGLFYYVVDMKGIRFGIGWLKYYGMNSLVAYCLFFVVDFRSISHSLFFGLEQWMGAYYPLIGVCFQSFAVWWIVKRLYDLRLFFKA